MKSFRSRFWFVTQDAYYSYQRHQQRSQTAQRLQSTSHTFSQKKKSISSRGNEPAIESSYWKMDDVGRRRGGVGDRWAVGEHERAIVSLGVLRIVGGGEIDAGTALERCEEGGCDAGAYPRRHVRQVPALIFLHLLREGESNFQFTEEDAMMFRWKFKP